VFSLNDLDKGDRLIVCRDVDHGFSRIALGHKIFDDGSYIQRKVLMKVTIECKLRSLNDEELHEYRMNLRFVFLGKYSFQGLNYRVHAYSPA
jgi:hypothetical protein